MLVVQVCEFGSDGEARYRMHDPSRALARCPGVSVVDCHFLSRELPRFVDEADVLVLQFVNDWDLLEICARRRRAGRITVFEANDYFFDLQPWNAIAGRWRNPTVQELYRQLLRLADGVQTGSDALARQWRARGARRVGVFANQLADVPALSEPPARPLTIGWGGSPGHLADWYAVAPTLQRWLDAHPDAHLAVKTAEVARDFVRLPAERYHFEKFGPFEEYAAFLQRLDIGIAPMLATDYNRGRSDVKYLEYAAHGVAGIYADLDPYRTVRRSETGLLYRTPGELTGALDALSADGAMRHRLRVAAYAEVTRARRIDDHIAARLDWYRGLMGTEPAAAEAGATAAPTDGYREVRAGATEQALAAALRATKPADGAAAFARLVEHAPDYLLAWQHYARLLNDARNSRAALDALTHAQMLRSDSARTLAEIGRTRHLLEEPEAAHAAFMEAIACTAHYLPVWQYLLRFLGLTGDEGREWGERAERLFPDSYAVALLAANAWRGEAAPRITRALDRFVPELTADQRPFAITAFHAAAAAADAGGAPPAEMLALWRRGCAAFPESARFASACGRALYRAGQDEEALRYQARALQLSRAADAARADPADAADALVWQLARHVLEARADAAEEC